MSDFPALSLDEVCELLESAPRNIRILTHVRPDGDTLGSATALYLYLIAMGKRVSLLCADPFPRRLAFLLEGITPTAPTEEDYLAVAVDVASPAQLGALYEEHCGKIGLMIDHHETGVPFAPAYIQPHAAAAGEPVYEILSALAGRGGPALNAEIALRIYTAISSDTGGFRYANTTPKTHRIAAELLAYGIRADRINHALFIAKSPEVLRAERIALENLRECEGGRISYTIIPLAARGELAEEFFETAIDIARARAGAEIALSMRERSGGEFRVSLRSVDADVAAVAAAFGGGGHLHAAGCTVKADDAEAAFSLLLPHLKNALNR